jgi:hypothetical protein
MPILFNFGFLNYWLKPSWALYATMTGSGSSTRGGGKNNLCTLVLRFSSFDISARAMGGL